MFEASADTSVNRATVRPLSVKAELAALRMRPPTLVLEGSTKAVVAGATIYAQDGPAEFIYQVASGMVRTITVRRDGRRVVHGFHLPGEIFGLERATLHRCAAEAVCETQVVQCSRRRLEGMASSDGETARKLWSWLLFSRDKTSERFFHLMHGSAFEKLAYFLIDQAWRTRSQGRIDLAMSRYDIADYLGLSSETVSRTFSVFRNRGLIATRGRQVTLLDGRIFRMGADAMDNDDFDDDTAAHLPRTFP
jgi:CRP-like cAMP-binding protein